MTNQILPRRLIKAFIFRLLFFNLCLLIFSTRLRFTLVISNDGTSDIEKGSTMMRAISDNVSGMQFTDILALLLLYGIMPGKEGEGEGEIMVEDNDEQRLLFGFAKL